jgi:hypothetical protein
VVAAPPPSQIQAKPPVVVATPAQPPPVAVPVKPATLATSPASSGGDHTLSDVDDEDFESYDGDDLIPANPAKKTSGTPSSLLMTAPNIVLGGSGLDDDDDDDIIVEDNFDDSDGPSIVTPKVDIVRKSSTASVTLESCEFDDFDT